MLILMLNYINYLVSLLNINTMYYINFHYAISIYNNDYKELDDLELEEIKEFLNDLEGKIHFDFDDTNFTLCNVSGYYSECVRYWIE